MIDLCRDLGSSSPLKSITLPAPMLTFTEMVGLVSGLIPAKPSKKLEALSRTCSEGLSSRSILIAPARAAA